MDGDAMSVRDSQDHIVMAQAVQFRTYQTKEVRLTVHRMSSYGALRTLEQSSPDGAALQANQGAARIPHLEVVGKSDLGPTTTESHGP